METAEYDKLTQYEDWYWWYRAERRAVVDAMGRLKLRPGARVLDAGCGSGRNLVELANQFDIVPYGVDVSTDAAKLWNGDGTNGRSLASVNHLPYAESVFDAAISVDVLCCEQVDTETAVHELARTLRPGGALILVVPAYDWLRSAHDTAVHCVRRFSRTAVCRLIGDAGLEIDRCHYLFSPFFPAIALTRIARQRTGTRVRSDLQPIPRWLNESLYGVAVAEQWITKSLSPPVGTTILAVAKKGPA